jgi:hypothetical protein
LIVSALAAGDVAPASDAAEAAWSHISGYRETAAINTAYIAVRSRSVASLEEYRTFGIRPLHQ